MKLSLISVNYNNAEGLKRTIQSIIPYRSPDVEYIIIDGNSTDESSDYIKEYYKQIDYCISEPDKGVFDAMNKGMQIAKGEYLLFINSGDVLKRGLDFNTILSFLTGEDIICFDIEMAWDMNGESFINTYPNNLDFKFFAEQSLPHQASFIKREKLSSYGGYNIKMKLAADWVFTLDAICLNGWSYKHISKHFSVYYLDGISSQYENHKLLWQEKEEHIKSKYPLYYSLYKEWLEKKEELYKLKSSASVRYLKKIGFLRWLKL